MLLSDVTFPHFWSTVCKTIRPMLSDRCLSCSVCPVLSVTFVHCGQTVGRIKMKLGKHWQVGLGRGHIVLDGDPASPPTTGHSPTQFSAHICCGQMAAWIKVPLGMELGLSPGDFVLDGDPAPKIFRPMFIIVIVISLDHCTIHSRCWFIQVQVQVLVFYAFNCKERV